MRYKKEQSLEYEITCLSLSIREEEHIQVGRCLLLNIGGCAVDTITNESLENAKAEG